MDDNVWEYPFGDLDEDDDVFFQAPNPEPLAGESINKLTRYFTIDA